MGARIRKHPRIESFDFSPGRMIAGKYEIISLLGAGWEGEVYLAREKHTGIECAAKFFFPHRNINNRAVKQYAKRLHHLRHCPIVIQYLTQDFIKFRNNEVAFLISEYVEGELLDHYLLRQPGQRIHIFQALHLLHTLARGIEDIHGMGEYHGDLHTENVIMSHFGLGFELKLLDLFDWKLPKKEVRQDDICDLIKIFYDALGGQRHYKSVPKEAREIICGLKRSLILKKFPRVGRLRHFVEQLEWK